MTKRAKQEEERRKVKEEAERLRLLAEERERNLKLIQDETREIALRKPILEDTVAVFESLLKKVKDHKKPIRDEQAWRKYLRCDRLPDTKIPSHVRAFLYQVDCDFLYYHDKHINWWLMCDKNSIMTQDISIKDRRRQTIDPIREPTGRFYDQKLRFMMKVYESLEDTLRRKKVSSSHLQDLITIRSSFREKAYDFLDVLTFEILLSIDREMKSMNPHVSHYSYSSPDFIKFIWSFKDVTLPKNIDKYRSINVQPLQMNVAMSSLLDLETTSVRVLWFKRDFYSDYCPSYLPSSFDMKFQNFDYAIDEEMKMRKYFRNKRVAEMREAREAYDIKMEALRKQEEADAKNKKNKEQAADLASKNKKNLKPKNIIEPPIVDDSTYVNVDDEYLEYENQIVEEEVSLLSPENLNLDIHDVNMRQHQILGGTYRIECLERPLQTKEIYQHLFVRLNERPNVLQYRNFHHIYEEPVLKNVKEERKSLFVEKLLEAKTKALLSLNKIEIKLSDKIIWWEEPIACRFEKWEESDEFLQLDPKLQDFNLNYEKYKERELQSLFKMPHVQFQNKLHIKDFQLSAYPEDIKMSSLVRYFLAPILPNDFPHYVEKLEMFEKKEREWRFYKARQIPSQDDITDEEMKDSSIQTVKILNDFLKIFEQKYSKPQEVFPQKIKRHNLEIVENPEALLAVQKAREELQKILIKEEECEPEIANDIPLEKEPLMLSELLDRITDIQKSLKTVFRVTQKKIEEIQIEEKPRRKSKKKIRISEYPRKSLVIPRRSIRRTSKKRKPSIQKRSTKRESLLEEVNSSATETTIESSPNEQKLFLIPHHKGKWITKDIHESFYDEKTKTFSFYAGCCGVFGLAIKKYYNLPFKNWELYPIIEEKTEKYVIMRIEGQKVSIEFKITLDGFTYKILKPGKVPRQELRRPVKIFELKKILTSINVNLFPELDAGWYVSNVKEKHIAMEFHSYKSMAAFCLSYHYKYHEFNRYGTRREIVLKSKLLKDEAFTNVLITPLKVLSVDAEILTTENYQMNLKYGENPPEQEFCADLYNFLKAEVDKTEHRVNQRSFMIFWHVQVLLMNLRPLSFSQ